MSIFLPFLLVLFSPKSLFAQVDHPDSLAQYSLADLHTLYKHAKTPQDKLPYVLALLNKGEQELNIQDTSFAKIFFEVGDNYRKMQNLNKAMLIQEEKALKSRTNST